MAYDTSDEEVLQRVRRIETRLIKLARAQGVDVTDDKVRVTIRQASPAALELSGLDVSYGDVLAFCRQSGINGIATIIFRGQILGSALIPKEVASAST